MEKIVLIENHKHKTTLCPFLNERESLFHGSEIIAKVRTVEFLESNNYLVPFQ
jgi:hypothetical protein